MIIIEKFVKLIHLNVKLTILNEMFDRHRYLTRFETSNHPTFSTVAWKPLAVIRPLALNVRIARFPVLSRVLPLNESPSYLKKTNANLK